MALTHALSTNNYGPAHLIVSTTASNGTHTTLAAAMADAVSGDTIFLRDSVTENVTLTAGVNIAAWTGGTLNTPSITGTLTMTTAGTCNISGIRLVTNSANILSVTGSAASIVNLSGCYLNCTNNTGINYTSSSASSAINLFNCNGDLGTTGISYWSGSSIGTLTAQYCQFTNSGGSSTVTTLSAGTQNIRYSEFFSPLSVTSTGAISLRHCSVNTSAQNAVCITYAGNTVSNGIEFCTLISGSAAAVSIGSGISSTILSTSIDSTNTNPVTGAGIVIIAGIRFTNSGIGINTTTQSVRTYDKTALWTPNLQINASSTGITYTTQLGGYTQIGNVVNIWALIVLSSKGASTGAVTISNIPVTTGASGQSQIIPVTAFNAITAVGYTTIGMRLGTSNNVADFTVSGPGAAIALMANTNVANTTQLNICGAYIID